MKIKTPAILIGLLLTLISYTTSAQEGSKDPDAIFIKKIYNAALSNHVSYDWLTDLSVKVGHRLAGSVGSEKAIAYTKSMLDTIGCSKVWLQPCMVPVWQRGSKEVVKIVKSEKGSKTLRALALGFSAGTPSKGITAEVIEVKNLDEVEKLGKDKIKGKIVFFNRPMDNTQVRTFDAYGGAVDQRVQGPAKASEYGAVGALVRSMTTLIDEWPHTGTTHFKDGVTPIPAIAIATIDAEMLSDLLKQGMVKVQIKASCKTLPDAPSNSVIGEIRGSEKPNEIIVVGGHLDSWDVGQGSHDDGAGVVQSMEVLYLMKKLGYKPKRTIRCVLFMNEENGLAGGKAYGAEAKKSKEKHIAGLESDSGGFSPRGISCEGDEKTFIEKYKQVEKWKYLFEPYDVEIVKGGSGADVGPLKDQGAFLMGLRPDSQRYFDFHHSNRDIIQNVNIRELSLGTAAMTSMIYLIDKYGID